VRIGRTRRRGERGERGDHQHSGVSPRSPRLRVRPAEQPADRSSQRM